MTERSIAYAVCEMTPELKEEVEAQINKALDKFSAEQDISKFLKLYFDSKHGPNWHCCVGKNFSSYVSYYSKHYIFFYIGQMAVLLYKL